MRVAVAVLVLTACRGGAPAAPDEAPSDFLIWALGEDGPETRWVDGTGRERGRAPGVLIASGDTVWTVELLRRRLREDPCSRQPNVTVITDAVELTDVVATSADERTRLVLVRIPDEGAAGHAELRHTAAIRASLGPVLFLEEGQRARACETAGATFAASAFMFDLETCTREGGTSPRAPDALGPRIRAAFERAAIAGAQVDASIRLAQSLPRWIDGQLTARHLAYVDVCPACGNGAWSTATSAVWIDDVRIPDEWRSAAVVPPAVADLLGGPEPLPTGVSWGVPGAAWRDRFAPE